MATRELAPGVIEVSVNRGDKMNALSSGVITALKADFKSACGDPNTRVIIFRGDPKEGRWLSPFGGADLDGLVNYDQRVAIPRDEAKVHMDEGIEAINETRELCRRGGFKTEVDSPGRVLVIGWIDGPCLAGGIEFVYGICDLVYATPYSYFGMPEILMCGMGGWKGPELIRRNMMSPLQVKEISLCLGNHNMSGRDTGFLDVLTMQMYGMLNGIFNAKLIEEHVLKVAKMAVERDPMALTANLEVADFPVDRDVTNTATDYMVALMMRAPWVEAVCNFFDRTKKKVEAKA